MKPFLTNAFVLVAKWLVVSERGDIPLLSPTEQSLLAMTAAVLGLALQKPSSCVRIRSSLHCQSR